MRQREQACAPAKLCRAASHGPDASDTSAATAKKWPPIKGPHQKQADSAAQSPAALFLSLFVISCLFRIDARRPPLVTAAGFNGKTDCHQCRDLCAEKRAYSQKLWKIQRQQPGTGCLAPGARHGVTVTVKPTAWLVPEVAITVMLEVPGGVPVFGGGVLLPPPQLTRQRHSVRAPNASHQRRALLPR